MRRVHVIRVSYELVPNAQWKEYIYCHCIKYWYLLCRCESVRHGRFYVFANKIRDMWSLSVQNTRHLASIKTFQGMCNSNFCGDDVVKNSISVVSLSPMVYRYTRRFPYLQNYEIFSVAFGRIGIYGQIWKLNNTTWFLAIRQNTTRHYSAWVKLIWLWNVKGPNYIAWLRRTFHFVIRESLNSNWHKLDIHWLLSSIEIDIQRQSIHSLVQKHIYPHAGPQTLQDV